jgi:predicted nucleotidyltransferase
MVENSVTEIIQYLKNSLFENGLSIDKIAVFGSYKKGNYTDQSDLDLIIITDDFSGKDIFERAEMTMDAEIKTLRKFMIPLDILKMTHEEYDDSMARKRFETELV